MTPWFKFVTIGYHFNNEYIMKNKTIEAENFAIYISDSTESNDLDNTVLEKYLNETVSVISKFIQGNQLDERVKKCEAFEVDITLCDEEEIQSLNLEHREKNKVTDVLSFPGYDNLRSGAEDLFLFEENIHFGDIVICRDVCERQAEEFNISYEQELIHLFIHGFLHLCGYDHEISDEEDKIHFSLEEELVKEIYENMGLDNGRVY